MPLVSGSSREDISKNIATERNAGKSAAQAAAISYSKAGKDSGESARKFDINDWFEVEANPLSKVGVFQYSGKFISKELDPNQMFAVYRPEEELADPECIKSFKLLPWVNDHPRKLLGNPDKGAIAAEEKGISGVIGEQVFFDKLDLMLKGNIKIFSKSMSDAIDAGKEELSVGYQCKYEYAPGTFAGEPYQYVQRQIRGNHLATVDDGRMGPDVAVLDELQFTIDGKEFKTMKKIPKIRAAMNNLITYVQDADEKAEKSGTSEEKSEIAQLQELLKKVAPLIKQLAETHSVMTGPETEEGQEPKAGSADPLDKVAKDAEEEKEKEGKVAKDAKDAKDAEEAAKAAKDAEEAKKDDDKKRSRYGCQGNQKADRGCNH